VENGAHSQIMVAVDPDLEAVSGKYFADCAVTKPSAQSLDYEMAEWLWNKSAELTMDSK
jgi:retinol dehydrogenase 13